MTETDPGPVPLAALFDAVLDVTTISADALRPYPGNPRLGDTDAIMESIKVNGFYAPLVVSNDGVILKGNHSYAAGMELGMTEFPCVVRPYGYDSPQARRVVLADNHTSDLGAGYDIGDLLQLLRSVEEDGGLYGTTYAGDDLDDLIARVQEDLSTPLDLDNVNDRNADLASKFDRYVAMGRRMIVLDYEQDVYVTVTAMFQRARERYSCESNAEAVIRMLREVTE